MRLSVACNLIPEGCGCETEGGLLVIDAVGLTVYVSCCNARIYFHSVYSYGPSKEALFVNCPAIIRLPSMCYLYGETPLVNCGPRSFFLILLNQPQLKL